MRIFSDSCQWLSHLWSYIILADAIFFLLNFFYATPFARQFISLFLFSTDPSNISTDGKTVTCTPHEMQLTLNRLTYPWLQPKYFDMHLVDNRCRPYHVNFTHIIVKTTYGNCKTVAYNSSYDVTYRNILMAFVKAPSGILITRVPDVLFPFQCRFNHKKRASISSELIEDTLNYPLGN